jgi:hypothetical protein
LPNDLSSSKLIISLYNSNSAPVNVAFAGAFFLSFMTRFFQFFFTAVLVCLVGSAHAQYGASRLRVQGKPYSYPAAVYSQGVVSNPSTAYENVVNFHWKRGDGTRYVILAGRYLQRAPYGGGFPTPYPPYAPSPSGPGNGYMNADSRLPSYSASDEVAPYLLKTGDYTANPADTTAQLLNALPGVTYYAYIWEYTGDGNSAQVLSPPPGSNLSWQTFFTQFHPSPQITSITLDAQRRPVITWITAAEDSVAGFRITQSNDSTTTRPGGGTLTSSNRTTQLSTITAKGFSTQTTTYTETLGNPVNGPTWFQVTAFLTDNSTYLPSDQLWSKVGFVNATAPLPVTLIEFTARRRWAGRARVDIAWQTASERDNDGFELQRSYTGSSWQTMWFIPGHNTSNQSHSYSTSDSCTTAAYYRLAQFDLSGAVTYSPVHYVAAVPGEEPLFTLSVYPNPGQGELRITGANQALPLQLLNGLGQVVREIPAATQLLNVSDLPRGLYILRQASHQTKVILN